jgi:hypothetical protein
MLTFASKAGTMDPAVTLSKLIIGQIFTAHENSTILNIGPRFTASENLTKPDICNLLQRFPVAGDRGPGDPGFALGCPGAGRFAP